MKDANAALIRVTRATSGIIKGKDGAADIQSLVDSITARIVQLNSARRVDAKSDEFKTRLIELLTEQKRILDGFGKEAVKNWEVLAREEGALETRYDQFLSEYGEWLPGFLKERGYELKNDNDH